MAPSSDVRVELCSDEDMAPAFLAVSKGFKHDAPFFDAYFPEHDTATGQKQGAERLLLIKHSEEHSYFVKAVLQGPDGASERIIGLALWTYMKEAPSDKLEELEDVQMWWPNQDDREYMKRLWKDYVIPRGKVVREAGTQGVYVLELLGVDRDYQRRGAGTALVSWGTRAADEKGLEAVVEGTPEGLKCYHSGGFITEIERMSFDVGEHFRSRKPPILTFLRRKPRKGDLPTVSAVSAR